VPTWFMLYRSRWFLLYLANIFPPALFFPINYYRDDILTGRIRISCLVVRPISHVFCKRRPVWLFSYFFYFATNIILFAVFVVFIRGYQRTVSSVSYLSCWFTRAVTYRQNAFTQNTYFCNFIIKSPITKFMDTK